MKTLSTTIASGTGAIAAVIHYPNEQGAKLAILCPGYLDTKDYPHLISHAALLAEVGYVVVRFDPTGIWESSGEVADYSVSQYFSDVKAIVDHMTMQNTFSEIVLLGHSLGGAIAILYASQDPRVTSVVGLMPSSLHKEDALSYKHWNEKGIRYSQRDVPGSDSQREFAVPYGFAEDQARYSVLGAARTLEIPLYLLAGALDDAITPQEVRTIFDAAHEPKQLVILEGIGHDYRHNAADLDIVNNAITKSLAL